MGTQAGYYGLYLLWAIAGWLFCFCSLYYIYTAEIGDDPNLNLRSRFSRFLASRISANNNNPTQGGAFGGNRGARPVLPEKGIFPLDHLHECDLALSFVSTFWAVVYFGEYIKSLKRAYILLFSLLSMFVAAAAVLMASAGHKKS